VFEAGCSRNPASAHAKSAAETPPAPRHGELSDTGYDGLVVGGRAINALSVTVEVSVPLWDAAPGGALQLPACLRASPRKPPAAADCRPSR
jgi:hypothetical protein